MGAYIACLLVYAQWKTLIVEAEAVLAAAGVLETTLYTPNGPAGILGLYVLPGSSLGRVFLNEFVVVCYARTSLHNYRLNRYIQDFMLGLVIWGSIDPTNVLVPPASVPFVIGMAYAIAIWGFATIGRKCSELLV